MNDCKKLTLYFEKDVCIVSGPVMPILMINLEKVFNAQAPYSPATSIAYVKQGIFALICAGVFCIMNFALFEMISTHCSVMNVYFNQADLMQSLARLSRKFINRNLIRLNSANMHVVTIPVLSDNYSYLIVDDASKVCHSLDFIYKISLI